MNMLYGMVAEAIIKTTEALTAILKMSIEFEKRISELEELHAIQEKEDQPHRTTGDLPENPGLSEAERNSN